jgi:hypothetical protein
MKKNGLSAFTELSKKPWVYTWKKYLTGPFKFEDVYVKIKNTRDFIPLEYDIKFWTETDSMTGEKYVTNTVVQEMMTNHSETMLDLFVGTTTDPESRKRTRRETVNEDIIVSPLERHKRVHFDTEDIIEDE